MSVPASLVPESSTTHGAFEWKLVTVYLKKRYIHNQVKSQDKFKYTQMIKKRINQPVCKLHFI